MSPLRVRIIANLTFEARIQDFSILTSVLPLCTDKHKPSSVLLRWSDFSRFSLYFKNHHFGFPGESLRVFLILRLCAFCDSVRPPVRCLAAESVATADAFCVAVRAGTKRRSRGRRWMRPRLLCFDANQIMFPRCLGVPTPMHINSLCPDLRHKI